MSEYWKSNPRKYCDFCKCWIADNKPSVDFHERGKRHNENVRLKLAEISKKGMEDYKTKLQEDDYMKSMEEEALKAYRKDIEANPDMMANKINDLAASTNATIVIGKADQAKDGASDEESSKPKTRWKEVIAEDGTSYYWNTETQETSWDVPPEGFIKKRKKKKKKEPQVDNVALGPMPKVEAFSQWESVKPAEEAVDLQLPELPANDYWVPEVVIKRPEISFKEKTVSLGSSSSSGVSFKKRKAAGDHKKNARIRNNDL